MFCVSKWHAGRITAKPLLQTTRLPGEKVVWCRNDSAKIICHISASQTFQSLSMHSQTLYMEHILVTKMPRAIFSEITETILSLIGDAPDKVSENAFIKWLKCLWWWYDRTNEFVRSILQHSIFSPGSLVVWRTFSHHRQPLWNTF